MNANLDVSHITEQVIVNALQYACEEARDVLIRGAHSLIVKENKDCSVGFFDSKGQMVVVGAHHAVHTASQPFTLKYVLKKFQNNLNPGDMILINDPFNGGLHLYDVSVFSPIFYEGGLLAVSGILSHFADIGAARPGFSCDAQEIYGEGIRFDGVKIAKSGEIDEDILAILRANVRSPDDIEADLRAQLAGHKRFSDRFLELIKVYGKETVSRTMQEAIDRSEVAARHNLELISDGTYESHGVDIINGIRSAIKVRVEKRGKSFEIDFSGTDAQRKVGCNLPYAATLGMVAYTLNVLVGGGNSFNEGIFKCFKVIAPEGSIVNPKIPAPVTGYPYVASHLVNILLSALADAAPEKIGGQCSVGGGFSLCYDDLDGVFVNLLQVFGGGMGATINHDGVDSFFSPGPSGGGKSVPIEIIDSPGFVMVERLELIQDSGGPGKFRGGLGHRTELKVLSSDMTWSVFGGITEMPTSGVFGGLPGKPWRFYIKRPTLKEKEINRNCAVSLQAGEILVIETSGGGGYGNPFERDPERVLRDVIDGKVSVEAATKIYGVIIDSGKLEIDSEATDSYRQKRNA